MINFKNTISFLLILFLILSILIFLFIAKVIYTEKNLGRYVFNEHSHSFLSNSANQEKVPPHLIFNHNEVINKAETLIGLDQEENFLDFKNLTNDNKSLKIFPLFGYHHEDIYYNGFSISHDLKVNLTNTIQDRLVGRVGRVFYQNGEYSDDVVVRKINDNNINVTGEIDPNKIPINLELYEFVIPKNFQLQLEKVTFLPFIEDAISTFQNFKIAARYEKNKKTILPGDKLSINNKEVIAKEVWKGPGKVIYINVSGSITPYIDSRSSSILVSKDKEEKLDKLIIPIELENNAKFFNGKQRISKFMINDSIKYANKSNFFFIVNKEKILVDYCINNICHFDYEKNKNLNLNIFGYDVYKKNFNYRNVVNNKILEYPNKTIKKDKNKEKNILKPKIWSTYTGLINYYYDDLNPSSFDYIIHALGFDSREKYLNDFINYSPDWVLLSNRNFDFTDFHGWSLSNSWLFYKNVLNSYHFIDYSDYIQFWKKKQKLITSPDIIETKHYKNFPITMNFSNKFDRKCELKLTEVTINYEFKYKGYLKFLKRFHKVIINVKNSLSSLPISIPTKSTTWSFPIVSVGNQIPELDLEVFSPLGKNIDLVIHSISANYLESNQKNLRAMFLPALSKDINFCALESLPNYEL